MLLRYKKYIWILAGIILLLVLSYLREGVFLTLNGVIDSSSYSNAYFSFLKDYFEKFDNHILIKLKWVLTALFSFSFMLLIGFFSYQFFRNISILKKIIFFYSGLLIIVSIVGLTGGLIGDFENVYTYIRLIMGFIQSPLLLFIILPSFHYLEKHV